RVGDAPIIGAGTYASNADGCAVSATGSGEYFIRATVARDICAAMGETYRIGGGPDGVQPGYAEAEAEIAQVGALGGEGGVIVMNRQGRFYFLMNTAGMYRGAVASDVDAQVAIYGDE
ncbi:MAG TPA: isoaspartyl peptidase/L-asparaginase, partial [Brevundimonas sp.]|nr:isoaspartyl peptidase/L-asparaginase [Brevundimonas sp.]